jgi:hypothetical protein
MSNGLRRRRWLVLAALGGVLAIMAVGAGIALAVSQGTAGELNYQRTETAISSGDTITLKARCPSTRHVTGGGYEKESAGTRVNASRPFDSGDSGLVPDDGWEVEFGAPSGGKTIVAVYAICDD